MMIYERLINNLKAIKQKIDTVRATNVPVADSICISGGYLRD